MILSSDNSTVLPGDLNGLVLDRTSLPIATLDDARALLPTWAREVDASIRDALLAAIMAMAQLLWARMGQSLGRFTSPALCDDAWLAPLWGVMLQRSRTPLESQGDYRARLLAGLRVVTPNAIRDAVSAIEPGAFVLEPATDCAFVADVVTTRAFVCYVSSATTRLRNDGGVTSALIASITSQTRPEFWVVLPPEFGALDDVGSVSSVSGPGFAWATTVASSFAYSPFVGVGTGSQWQQLITEIESRRGHGVPWFAVVDPYLHTLR